MVATTYHRRQSSSGGIVGGKSTRRRPSLRRPSEVNSNKIPVGAAAAAARSNILRAQQQQQQSGINSGGPRRASGSLLQQSTLHHDWRRPSAPANVEAPRLSIADRFMASTFSHPPSPPPPPPPVVVQQADDDSNTSSSYAGRTSTVSRPSTDPVSGRLTIADTFIKNSSSRSLISSSVSSNGDGDNSMNTRHPAYAAPTEPTHPLEPPPPQRSTLDTHLALDLDFALPSPASTLDVGRQLSRPFGSQETLVQPPNMDKKLHEFEKEGSIADYETCSLRSSSSTMEHCSNSNEKSYHHHDEKWLNMSSEELAVHNSRSRGDGNNNDNDEAKGMWIACCFLSCNGQQRRPQQPKEPRKCGRRGWVFGSFIFFILLIIAAYLLWPRTPLMRIEGATLLSPARITETHQGVMVGNVAFESQWLVNVTVDNRQNRVPTRLTQIEVLAKDALTGLVIGKGDSNDNSNEQALAASTISTIQLQVSLDYQARDDTDTTFSTLKKACTQQPPKTYHDSKTNQTITEQPKRESLQLHFWITLHIFGLDWVGYRPTLIATPATGGFACPLS
ncbi:hypothetical protein BDB00DRAFT_924990 [Zychaea mexicana]|uniref:uncharacterized protein n=1 Tax=Zychaea mexicana TaxID=64656 RepID=UPI0022FECFDF|nr:uncharacterized protein BDB00DRAFT_924990 [Zychaea mexicana]KAI9498705.1 hypothetical protein BDB00DRAFT_924990 [Zychaea mexicana]